MLGFFRRFVNSKVGVIVTFIVLGVIALAFAAGDVTNLATGSGGITGNNVAKVGGASVTAADLRQRAQQQVEAAREQQPTADMAGFLAQGGLEQTLESLITTTALQQFGHDQGMIVSKRLVDGQIASIPGLQGPTGRFDEALFRRLLGERRLTEAQVRDDIARSILVGQLTGPTVGAAQVPQQLALPYASLLLERRAGQIGFIPAEAVNPGAAPSAQDVQAFYQRNLARYGVPERRSVRYAVVTPEAVRARAVPSEAEIAAAYAADRAKYQATERRTVAQVVVADQAGANAIAQRVRAGASLADAARAAGLEASTLTALDKAALAAQTSPALADAAFAAERGALVGPVRTPFGFSVGRVEAVEQVAGRTLDQVRGELVTALTTRKTAEALADLRARIDDGLAGNATFDEAVADAKLQPQTTPPLAQGAVDPLDPASRPDPALVPLVAAAFGAEDGDGPQLVQTAADGSFAIVAVGQVVPAAPRPLAQIQERVTADLVADRRRQAARRVAGEVLARVNRGEALPQALRQTGLPLPAVRPISAARGQLAQARGGAEPALALLFSMPRGATRLLEAPDNAGWLVIKLDQVVAGDASRTPAAVTAARRGIAGVVGREYVEQFARAVRADVGVRTDDAALARVKADLSGGGADN